MRERREAGKPRKKYRAQLRNNAYEWNGVWPDVYHWNNEHKDIEIKTKTSLRGEKYKITWKRTRIQRHRAAATLLELCIARTEEFIREESLDTTEESEG